MPDQLIDEVTLAQLAHDTGDSVLPVLVAAFVEEIGELMPRLADALDVDDYTAIARDIHSLKSSSGTFGAARLQSLSNAMDAAYKKNQLERALSLGVELHVGIRESVTAYRERFGLET